MDRGYFRHRTKLWYNMPMTWLDWLFICIGWMMLAVGFLGCVVPVLPGPTIAFAALFLALAVGDHSLPSGRLLVVAGAVTAAVTALDYVVPALGAKRFHCSRSGTFGCLLGTVAGLFFMPFGIFLGPFLGALAGELLAGKRLGASMKGAFGAFLGFLFGIVLKFACCGLLAYWFWRSLP